ncbi:uncharacterized protein FIESC28_00193 [Fusarium coffeatum]|uniref:AB hydrolase-1 domain-containing protein n=1 Tax=Fusarium coffeatum TaxID=231269 RepID=A0A366SE54_9HYPO|nr:uncharacterized protein FIESC28_00193 [Fusarium coffeatum]RBR26925.1 hypothetical protein FIESC28_00193 [Fusarium coffeatum]
MTSKPTLIFVPGAWHTPKYWGKVISTMESKQYKCKPVTLLTTLNKSKDINFASDVTHVRDAIKEEISSGQDVVLVVHSYGGAVGASAIKQLSRKTASCDENKGHVIGLFMVGTGFVAPGMSFLEGIGGKPPPTWDADYENNTMPIKVDPIDMLYHDLPKLEAEAWVEKLTEQALTSVTDGYEIAHEGWKDVPVWYIMTTEDRALPLEVQRLFADTAEKSGADLTRREIASSHSPMLSKPEETSKHLEDAIEAFTASDAQKKI